MGWLADVGGSPRHVVGGAGVELRAIVLQALLARTAERGASGVVLHASAAGRPLYEWLGFVPTNEMRYAPAPASVPNDLTITTLPT